MQEIIVIPYDSNWPGYYEAEKLKLLDFLNPDEIADIQHFGSTSIPGLSAKPIIDIIVGFKAFSSAAPHIAQVIGLDYEYMEFLSVAGGRLFLQKNPHTHNLHFVEYGTEHWVKPLIFRDFIRDNAQERMEYEQLKLDLAIKYRNDREHYTHSKTSFVNSILRKAGVSDAH